MTRPASALWNTSRVDTRAVLTMSAAVRWLEEGDADDDGAVDGADDGADDGDGALRRRIILGCAQCWGTYLGACGAVVAVIYATPCGLKHKLLCPLRVKCS